VRSWNDVDELDLIGCYGAIIGKAIYEGKLLLNEIPVEYK
jgi:phosphoribosylformimino-5-aminoimidazole carboxamide ribonucleotide (ProFAR) isomerase